MKELIKDCHRGEPADDRLQREEFDLVGPDGHIILPRLWRSIIQPNLFVTIHMWPARTLEGAQGQEDQVQRAREFEEECDRNRLERRENGIGR